jgi:hypothetical protein
MKLVWVFTEFFSLVGWTGTALTAIGTVHTGKITEEIS